jgi:glycosyltransferase involved in cell wall biosynthesis
VAERIAILSTSYPAEPGDASGHFVAAEAEALARAGHHVLVVTTRAANPHRANAEGDGALAQRLQVVRLAAGEATGWPGIAARLRQRPQRALALLGWLWNARRVLRELGPFDRTIAHFMVPAGFPLATSSRNLGALEIVAHGSDARLCARLPRPLRRALRASFARAGASFRCSSEGIARIVEGALELAPFSTSVVAPRVDLGVVPARAVAREQLGLDAAPVAVVVGRLVAGKRVSEALAALRLLPHVRTIVIGDGPELETLARSFPEARFLGRLPRPSTLTWIAAADVLVSASRDEGAPSAVREARALDVPVAARPAGDIERWARSDRGLVVVP